jgi:hypothetical protein
MPSYSQHARQRMRQRGVTEADVTSALKRRSGEPCPGNDGSVVVLGFAPGGRILKTVLTSDYQCVISVMWLD